MKTCISISFGLLIITLFISCGKDEGNFNDCIDSYFSNNPTLVKYNNQDLLIACNFFVKTITIKNDLYFFNDCYCADMILKLVDCNGKEAPEEIYDCFHKNYDSIEIIGIYL